MSRVYLLFASSGGKSQSVLGGQLHEFLVARPLLVGKTCRQSRRFHRQQKKRDGSLPTSPASLEATKRCIPNPPAVVSKTLRRSPQFINWYSPLASLHRATATPAAQPISTSKSCTATLYKLWPQGFFAFVQPAAHWSSPSVLRFVFRSLYAHSTHTARTVPSSRPVRSLPHS
jgi:hypothetical protein